MQPVGSWSDWTTDSGVRERAELAPVGKCTDDEIDALYAQLVELEHHGLDSAERRDRHASLQARIEAAEQDRAEEMSSYFWRHQALDPAKLSDLLKRVDAALER